MIQELSKQELNDVAAVMLKSKEKFLSSTSSIKLFVLLGAAFTIVSPTLFQVSEYVGQIGMFLSIMCIAVVVYIILYRRGLKKNIQQMIEKRIGVPMEVGVTDKFITYNNKKYAVESIDGVKEYHDLYFLTIKDSFMVMKKESGIDRLCNSNSKLNYAKYRKPFNLFEK